MRVSLKDLPAVVSMKAEAKWSCITDTNALFAASMPLDRLNEWAEAVFSQLKVLEISAFTNINIRSEFMDLQRRVLVPEGLVSLYDQSDKASMNSILKAQLRSLKTFKDESALAGKLFKFNDQQMKKYRELLTTTPTSKEWEEFCLAYLHPYITNVWDSTIEALKIQFVGTQAIENREYFERDPEWKGMTDIIGRFGIGSSDAMIVNLFGR